MFKSGILLGVDYYNFYGFEMTILSCSKQTFIRELKGKCQNIQRLRVAGPHYRSSADHFPIFRKSGLGSAQINSITHGGERRRHFEPTDP